MRVLWRINPKAIWKNGGVDFEGEIAGDYTILVASRIPDDILADIRAHGGSLRLKFRLKPDGVMLGWDIERKAPLGNVQSSKGRVATFWRRDTDCGLLDLDSSVVGTARNDESSSALAVFEVKTRLRRVDAVVQISAAASASMKTSCRRSRFFGWSSKPRQRA